MIIIKLPVGFRVMMREAFFSDCGVGTIVDRTDVPVTTIEVRGDVVKYYGYRVRWDGGEGISPWLPGADLVAVGIDSAEHVRTVGGVQ